MGVKDTVKKNSKNKNKNQVTQLSWSEAQRAGEKVRKERWREAHVLARGRRFRELRRPVRSRMGSGQLASDWLQIEWALSDIE